MQTTLKILQECTNRTDCGWPEFITLVNQLIGFGIFLAVTFATFTFAYAGFKMMMAQGSSGEISAAKSMMTNAALGIIIVLIAWLIVQFILTNLGLQAGYSLLKP